MCKEYFIFAFTDISITKESECEKGLLLKTFSIKE